MGFVRDKFGVDLTGGGQRQAAQRAANDQIAAQREGLAQFKELTDPFRQLGTQAADVLSQGLSPGVGNMLFQPQDVSLQSAQEIIDDPFFQAMRDEQERSTLAQRASLGLASAPSTRGILDRNLLLLGNQFRQQGLNNDLAMQQSRLAQNQARFNQLFNIAGMGANAATGQGTAGINALTNIGQLQGVGPLAAAQVASNQGGQLMQGLGAIGSMFGGQLLGGIGGMFGGGGAVGSGISPTQGSFFGF